MEVNPLSLTSPLTAEVLVKTGASADLAQTVAAVRAVNKSGMFGEDRQLSFARDPDTQQPVIRIVSRKTGEVLDQIPAEQVLRIMADLRHQGKGGTRE